MLQMMLGQTQTSPLLHCQHRCRKCHQQLSLPRHHQKNRLTLHLLGLPLAFILRLHCLRHHRAEAVRLVGLRHHRAEAVRLEGLRHHRAEAVRLEGRGGTVELRIHMPVS